MKKQTAIEFLVDEFKEKLIGNNVPEWVEKIIQQSLEMEKEQIIESYRQGGIDVWADVYEITKSE
jgi:hypothetical protein